MFLPILLLRDLGWWSFAVFALPNVIGAAAMGWTVRPGGAGEIVRAHRGMVIAFSAATMLFHAWWLPWVLASWPAQPVGEGMGDASRWTHWAWWGAAAAAGAALVAVCLRGSGGERDGHGTRGVSLQVIAPALWAASLALLVLHAALTRDAGASGAASAFPRDLAALAPVCIFGFLGCPYLDATFLSAHDAAGRAPRRVFALGFGVLFFVMIIGTLTYANERLDAATPWAWAVAVHVVMQSAFTVAAHGGRVAALSRPDPSASRPGPGATGVLLGGLAALLAVGGGVAGALHVPAAAVLPRAVLGPAAEMPLGELVYRCFMACYGLAFPAYVWLAMVPTWRRPAPPTRRTLAVWAVAVVAATPMFWIGFVQRHEVWLFPGLALVVLARLLVGAPGRGGPGRADGRPASVAPDQPAPEGQP